MLHILTRLKRIIQHRWISLRNPAGRIFTPALRTRLAQHVSASESQHTGQIRIFAESALPPSYLWRDASSRERAITVFAKLRVWDTEHNNGVLVYLLLAERSIEIVADRGLNHHVPAQIWREIAARMGLALADEQWEHGLLQALDEATALLKMHYPTTPGAARDNELADAPVVGW